MMGYTTQTASDGAEVVGLINSGLDVSVILMDIEMPVMNGLEATRAIRSIEGVGRTVRIIGHTGRSGQDVIDACLAAGMNSVVTKGLLDDILTCLSSEDGGQDPSG